MYDGETQGEYQNSLTKGLSLFPEAARGCVRCDFKFTRAEA